MRRLRTAVLFIILLILFLIQIVLAHRDPRVVKIGEMKPYMNFSTVRVIGTLEQDARWLRNGSIFLLVNDGSGLLPVFQNGPSNESALAGSRIVVDGTLSVGVHADVRLQALSSADVQIEPIRYFYSRRDGIRLADVTAEQQGESISVVGRVSRVWNPESGSSAPHRITLVDESGILEVVHWLDSPPVHEPGEILEARGSVQVYRGKVQLKVWHADHIGTLVN